MSANCDSPSLPTTLKLMVGMVLIGAGVLKLKDPHPTAAAFSALWSHGPVPGARTFARCIALIELLIGSAQFQALKHSRAGELALALLVVFTAALILLEKRGYRAGCGCFGVGGSSPSFRIELARNVVLVAAAFAAMWMTSLDPCAAYSVFELPASALLVPVCTLAVFIAVYALASELGRHLESVRNGAL